MIETERGCLDRYVQQLEEVLGIELLEVTLFGSAARGEMWPPTAPMHSDVDIVVVTASPVAETVEQRLIDATYPLFLECGRQISPHFFTHERVTAPATERDRGLVEQLTSDGMVLWRPAQGTAAGT
jgi:predicted nucleotidyltransferase